ncbi:hypothetical protein Pint_07921 [Pistacia integerrima]|uniref:Uncharacterized protein n=1 Tax=Pistacia integerrima TaxID=434235 RepID=A0ACC0XT12_9ROSI|nr:hypothetical protein Pint_07921 [Pistacia integerrima]
MASAYELNTPTLPMSGVWLCAKWDLRCDNITDPWCSRGGHHNNLRIYNGDIRYYSGDVVATGLYDKWFRLNLIHDVGGGTVTVYINGVEKYSTKDRGQGSDVFQVWSLCCTKRYQLPHGIQMERHQDL